MRKLIFFVTLSLLFNTFCKKKNTASETALPVMQAVAVHVEKIRKEPITPCIHVTGQVEALHKVTVYPRAAGLVVHEAVKIGSPVKRDMVLAEIRQDIPGMDYANIKIEATSNGIITNDFIEVGSRASMQSPAYEISQIHPILISLSVPEQYIRFIAPGMMMTITLDALPDEQFTGTVTEIMPVVDTHTRSITIKAIVRNPKHSILPGMFARAQLNLQTHTGLIVPLDAVLMQGAERYVFVVKNRQARMVPVETGEFFDEFVEVNGRLRAGDTVVVTGQNKLSDGISVEIVKE